jgi:hypothetical protein
MNGPLNRRSLHCGALWSLSPPPKPGAPHPRFPMKYCGFPELHSPFLKERRTRGPVQSCVQEIRGISLVFREMSDTAGLSRKPVAGVTAQHGCPMFAPAYVGRKRWAKPFDSFFVPDLNLSSPLGPERSHGPVGPPKVMTTAPVKQLLFPGNTALSFVIRPKRSEVERSAVQRRTHGNV